LGEQVVNVTDACDHPSEVLNLPNIGCRFEPNLETINDLKPDLVIGLKTAHLNLETLLKKADIGLKLVNPPTVDQPVGNIAGLGSLLGATNTGIIVNGLMTRLNALDASVAKLS
jgi:ABC-type hemin transport system substrate-binding protein